MYGCVQRKGNVSWGGGDFPAWFLDHEVFFRIPQDSMFAVP